MFVRFTAISIFFVTMFSLFVASADAASWSVEKPCSDEVAYSGDLSVNRYPITVAALSFQIFVKEKVPFLGNEKGILSLMGSPMGEESITILARDEWLISGWCYEIDGEIPSLLVDQAQITSSSQHLNWFFGVARNVRGEWVSMCERASQYEDYGVCAFTEQQ